MDNLWIIYNQKHGKFLGFKQASKHGNDGNDMSIWCIKYVDSESAKRPKLLWGLHPQMMKTARGFHGNIGDAMGYDGIESSNENPRNSQGFSIRGRHWPRITRFQRWKNSQKRKWRAPKSSPRLRYKGWKCQRLWRVSRWYTLTGLPMQSWKFKPKLQGWTSFELPPILMWQGIPLVLTIQLQKMASRHITFTRAPRYSRPNTWCSSPNVHLPRLRRSKVLAVYAVLLIYILIDWFICDRTSKIL